MILMKRFLNMRHRNLIRMSLPSGSIGEDKNSNQQNAGLLGTSDRLSKMPACAGKKTGLGSGLMERVQQVNYYFNACFCRPLLIKMYPKGTLVSRTQNTVRRCCKLRSGHSYRQFRVSYGTVRHIYDYLQQYGLYGHSADAAIGSAQF